MIPKSVKKKFVIIQLFHIIAERGYQIVNDFRRERGAKYLKKNPLSKTKIKLKKIIKNLLEMGIVLLIPKHFF